MIRMELFRNTVPMRLRFALIQDMSAGNDQRLGRSKIIANRNFCNKLWNIARYIEDVLGNITSREEGKPESLADHWILTKLQHSQEKISSDLDNFRFTEAYDTLYHFIWDDLADWYIEVSKAAPNKPLLAQLLEQIVILAHPFAPFLTETIWQTLAWEKDSILAIRELQKIGGGSKQQAAQFTDVQAIVTEVRFITKALNAKKVILYYKDVAFLSDNATTIKHLAHLQAVSKAEDDSDSDNGILLINTPYKCWLSINRATAKAYAKELAAKQLIQKASIKQLEARLSNKSYLNNAPQAVVDQTKQQLAAAKELLETLSTEEQRFAKT